MNAESPLAKITAYAAAATPPTTTITTAPSASNVNGVLATVSAFNGASPT